MLLQERVSHALRAARKNLIEPARHKRCRFKYPRKRQRKASVAVRGGCGKRAYIALRRQHPWVNTYNPHIMLAWRGNIDIQFIADPAGSAEYATRTAYYSCATTKPERSALDRRMKRAISSLPAGSSVRQRTQRCLNAFLGARQVPVQQAVAVLLGTGLCPIVDSSRTFVNINIKRPEDQSHMVHHSNCALAVAEEDDVAGAADAANEPGTMLAKKKLIDAYYARPGTCADSDPLDEGNMSPLKNDEHPDGILWKDVCLYQFVSWLYIPAKSTRIDCQNRWSMTNGVVVAMHNKPAVVLAYPYATADETNPISAWAWLRLYLPHTSPEQLTQNYVMLNADGQEVPDSVAALAAARSEHRLSALGEAAYSRQQQVKEARAAYALRGTDDVSEDEEGAGGSDDDDLVLLDTEPNDAHGVAGTSATARSTGVHFQSHDAYVKLSKWRGPPAAASRKSGGSLAIVALAPR